MTFLTYRQLDSQTHECARAEIKKDLLGLHIQLDDTQLAKNPSPLPTVQSTAHFWEVEERIVTCATSCAEKLRQQKVAALFLMVLCDNPIKKEVNNTAIAM